MFSFLILKGLVFVQVIFYYTNCGAYGIVPCVAHFIGWFFIRQLISQLASPPILLSLQRGGGAVYL